jgi:2-hydroxy-3-oxopropionate reductase
VFASLPAPPVLREVARDVARGEKIKTLVDLSTTGSRMQKEVAALLRPHRITLLDAPVSGGATGAEKGTLAVMVAGDAKTIATLRKPLGVLGKLFIVGNKPGQAQLLKLLNNMLSQTALAVSLEALVAGVKGGLDADLMIAAINAGSGRNTATEDKIPRAVLTRTFDFGFPIAGACKDIGLAVEECQAMGLPMVVGSAVRQLWQFAYNQGGGKEDMTALVKFLEPWAKVTVRGRAARGRR